MTQIRNVSGTAFVVAEFRAEENRAAARFSSALNSATTKAVPLTFLICVMTLLTTHVVDIANSSRW